MIFVDNIGTGIAVLHSVVLLTCIQSVSEYGRLLRVLHWVVMPLCTGVGPVGVGEVDVVVVRDVADVADVLDVGLGGGGPIP